VDDSNAGSTAAEWKLTAGEQKTGYICPRTDVDHYWFTSASDRTILGISLKNTVTMSQVDLCYSLSSASGNVGGQCDENGADGITDIQASHYLASAGTYFLEIRDASGDDEDVNNAYGLTITQTLDPDTHEPNNDKASATTLSASVQGYVSFLGDQDWYKISVPGAKKIMTIDLTAAQGPVDLRYSLYKSDGSTLINSGVNPQGASAATAIKDVLAVAESGDYYLMVKDEGDDESSLTEAYTLSISLQDNPDKEEPENNSHDGAVVLTSGTAVHGYIATRGDQDWYKIDVTGGLLEIDLEFPASMPDDMEPVVDLVVGDSKTSCSAGDACNLLNSKCNQKCYQSETGPEIAACRNAQCISHECDTTHENRCRAAGFCMEPEGHCAYSSLSVHGVDWSLVGLKRHVHTVAPAFGSVYYLVVRDYRAAAFDHQHAYQLTVTVRSEPDTNEPNGLYIPRSDNQSDLAVRTMNKALATTIQCHEVASSNPLAYECTPMNGALSFRGDQDWFKIVGLPKMDENPQVEDSKFRDWDLQVEGYLGISQSELKINYLFYFDDNMWRPQGDFTNTVSDPTGTAIWGDGTGECLYLCGEYHQGDEGSTGEDYYLRIIHPEGKGYNFNKTYHLVLKAYHRCPLECEYCKPDATSYACPNPGNTCPSGNCN
jgi:hypothetical protein